MHARVVLGVGIGVLFREVSSIQGSPYRGIPLTLTCVGIIINTGTNCHSPRMATLLCSKLATAITGVWLRYS